jgi:hypothetical protein
MYPVTFSAVRINLYYNIKLSKYQALFDLTTHMAREFYFLRHIFRHIFSCKTIFMIPIVTSYLPVVIGRRPNSRILSRVPARRRRRKQDGFDFVRIRIEVAPPSPPPSFFRASARFPRAATSSTPFSAALFVLLSRPRRSGEPALMTGTNIRTPSYYKL